MQQIHNATSHNVYHLKISCQVAKQLIPASVKPARAVIMIVSRCEIIITVMLPDFQDTIAGVIQMAMEGRKHLTERGGQYCSVQLSSSRCVWQVEHRPKQSLELGVNCG